jgi:hypothetical protein
MKKFYKREYYQDGSNLVTESYKGYTYDPVIEEEQVIHHITSPKGISFGVAPNWFKNLSDHDYATPKEFKSAVDEIESKRPYTSLPIRH